MVDEETKTHRKTVKYGFLIIACSYMVGNWIATQLVAAACGYNLLLGANLAIGGYHIYPPYKYYLWTHDAFITQTIPHILGENERIIYFAICIGLLFTYFISKALVVNTNHGSARFAIEKDIDRAGLGKYNFKKQKKKIGLFSSTKTIRELKDSGVVIGINPYTGKLMLHDGPEHIFLAAPSRSGKGVNTIIPTGLLWKHSIFFFDVKSELWQATAGYRQKVLGQKVMKFEPLCSDGSTARWNPLAEVNFHTPEEFGDVQTIVSMLVKPDGEKKGGDPFWDNAGSALLNGTILHLLYQHYQEKKPLPCPTDVMSFLSSPDQETDDLFEGMRRYPHISKEEFLEMEYMDSNGERKQHENVLKKIYGEYIRDFSSFNEYLQCDVHTIDELKAVIKNRNDVNFEEVPFSMLLTHPKVAEAASNMINTAAPTRASIMMTAQTCLALYQNPLVQKNTAVSDFCIKDLLNPKHEVSMYLVMQLDDVATLKPLSRLFINTLLSKLIRDMKFEKDTNKKQMKKQRLLLMLDEFPQLGCLKKMEFALAVCAGYGIKVCIVSQDVNQINNEYTKDNSIASNCHVHIYFTPNLDTNGSATAASISKSLGKKTVKNPTHNDGGGGFFKGSNSTAYMSRELMTPDEVSHMDSAKELVFVAGHYPIYGDKLKYYEIPFFMEKILPEPAYSDMATAVQNYDELFAVHAAESKDRLEKAKFVQAAKTQFFEEVKQKNAENFTAETAEKAIKDQNDSGIEESVDGQLKENLETAQLQSPVEVESTTVPEKMTEKEKQIAEIMKRYSKKTQEGE